ncbi:peptidylprolyl isomerase [Tropicibacter sp. R15_0]|uniref:peptidylprolyl isomerase n=1 Tax=Tropicibacter sp. R15_0 TaxID=2821101 RepID=UPI001ADBCF70|nr:peptidylprolyl isomerase [Tropicibacter sp. R15_0]MBO9465963.1 peptidylprolyl isomerase [Tropicibacter sp. R15_0]
MLKSRNFWGTVALTVSMALPVQAEELKVDSVVATVDGVEITLGHMLMVRAFLPEQYQQLPGDVLWDGILDQLIQQQVLSTDEMAKETPRVRIALDNERRSQLASVVLAELAEQPIPEDEIKAAYEAEYANGPQGKEFNASHILVETEEEAQAIVAELAAGADFATLAKEKSTGPSGPGGGALGWFGPGMMVPPFQEAVEKMEPGGVGGPVKTQFGWHVIKLNETRIKEAPSLDQVRAQLESQVRQQMVTKKIEELVNAANVTRTKKEDVDTSILSNLDLLEN